MNAAATQQEQPSGPASGIEPAPDTPPAPSTGVPEGRTPDAHHTPAAPARRRRTRRIALAAGFIVVAVVSAGALIAVALAQESPRWWTTVNPDDPRTIELAEAVENGLTSALTRVRPSAPGAGGDGPGGTINTPWRVYITNEQANAWLNVRLERWLADQTEQGAIDFEWPREVKQVQVCFEEGRIHVGARVVSPDGGARSGPRPRTLGATLRVEFGPDGSLWLTAERIEIGRLPVPAGWVLGSARAGGSSAGERKVGEVSEDLARLPQTRNVLAAFRGERPVISRPVIRLADGRRVRLLAVEPRDGRLVITAQTEVRERGTRP